MQKHLQKRKNKKHYKNKIESEKKDKKKYVKHIVNSNEAFFSFINSTHPFIITTKI